MTKAEKTNQSCSNGCLTGYREKSGPGNMLWRIHVGKGNICFSEQVKSVKVRFDWVSNRRYEVLFRNVNLQHDISWS